MRGTVLPGGADWQLIRHDGVAELDARYTLQTDDGAAIHVHNRALRHGPPEVMAGAAGRPSGRAGQLLFPRRHLFTKPTRRATRGSPSTLLSAPAVREPANVKLSFYKVL